MSLFAKKSLGQNFLYDENILKEYNAEFAMPDILIELSLEADSFLSF